MVREDVRGVADVALATPFFTHVIRNQTVGHLDNRPTGYLDFWPSEHPDY